MHTTCPNKINLFELDACFSDQPQKPNTVPKLTVAHMLEQQANGADARTPMGTYAVWNGNTMSLSRTVRKIVTTTNTSFWASCTRETTWYLTMWWHLTAHSIEFGIIYSGSNQSCNSSLQSSVTEISIMVEIVQVILEINLDLNLLARDSSYILIQRLSISKCH